MNQAYEKVKMMVGMEVDEEAAPSADDAASSFMDDFNRQCTLTTKQVLLLLPLSSFLRCACAADGDDWSLLIVKSVNSELLRGCRCWGFPTFSNVV